MENETKISRCTNGVFISYAHVDNTKLGDQGWVDALHQRLADRLYQLLGEKPEIWRDPLLTGNEYFRVTLVLKVAEVTILVAILTPRYIKSEECLKELHQFCQSEPESDQTDNKARVFKVIKTPIDDADPEELEKLGEFLGYKFYEIDPATRRPREFCHVSGFDSFPKFVQSVDDVAWDIKEKIKHLKERTLSQPAGPNAATIYLAETESSLEAERNNIRRELKLHGYTVLPNRDLPREVAKLEQVVRDDLSRSRFSLHLIGENYGFIPEKERVRSSVRLQYELALERSNKADFSQLVWIPRWLKAQDDRQQEFIESLRRNTNGRTEVLQDIREDLKSDLLNRLKTLNTVVVKPEPSAKPLRVYLICNRKDYDSIKRLKEFLYDEKFEVIGLAKGSNRIKDHNQYLSLCDVAMIFQDQADEDWREQKLCDLRRIGGDDLSGKLVAKAVYLAGPLTEEKKDFRTWEAKVMKEGGEFPPKELIEFLEEVRGQAAARSLRTKGVGG